MGQALELDLRPRSRNERAADPPLETSLWDWTGLSGLVGVSPSQGTLALRRTSPILRPPHGDVSRGTSLRNGASTARADLAETGFGLLHAHQRVFQAWTRGPVLEAGESL